MAISDEELAYELRLKARQVEEASRRPTEPLGPVTRKLDEPTEVDGGAASRRLAAARRVPSQEGTMDSDAVALALRGSARAVEMAVKAQRPHPLVIAGLVVLLALASTAAGGILYIVWIVTFGGPK